MLHKSKDQVPTSFYPSLIKSWEQLAHGSDGGDRGRGGVGGDCDHTQRDLKDTKDGVMGMKRMGGLYLELIRNLIVLVIK